MLCVLIWWLVLQTIGLLALPITCRLLRFLPDRGFGFARQVGLLLAGYLFWLLVTLGILQNTMGSVIIVLLLVGGFSAFLFAREGREMLSALRERRRIIVVTETLFLVALAGFALFRAHNPDIAATEKPMEFGFINAILRSRTFPPDDPWLSGYAISYYHFGYVIAAMLTRLSGLPSDITFNLTGVTLFALTVNGSSSLVYNLAQAHRDHRGEGDGGLQTVVSWAGILAGLLGSVLVALMGNLEGLFELIRARGGGSEALWQWLDVKNLRATPPSAAWYPDDSWWWWRAARVIHDRDAAGRSIEVIDEFPFFSFLLGDNHPHVLALPFALLALALALNILLSRPREAGGEAPPEEKSAAMWDGLVAFMRRLWEEAPLELVLWGVLLGSLGFLNTWDYPIYLGIVVLAYALHRQFDRRPGWEWLSDVVSLGLVLLVLGIAFYFPFYVGFRSQAGGIGLVGTIKTRLHQYLLMMGVFVFAVISFLAALLMRRRLHGWRGGGFSLLAHVAVTVVIILALFSLKTPLYQFLLMMGVLVFALIGFFSALLVRRLYGWGSGRFSFLAHVAVTPMMVLALFCLAQGWWTAVVTLGLAAVSSLMLIWGGERTREEGQDLQLERSTLFALLLITVGLLLMASVEFVFLRDTFGTRMNTVFKFYYQAWLLLGIGSAYGAFYIVDRGVRSSRGGRVGLALWCLLGVALVGAGLSYTVAATASKAGGFAGEASLDGTRYVERLRKDDYQAIQWLRAHAEPGAVLLEATGGSYSEYNWVSAHTGIPTVLGWGGHELQWRGNYDEAGKREPDIAAIYQSVDPNHTMSLLAKYDVDYVYIGRLERNKYHLSSASTRKFDRIMTRVYENRGVIIYGWAR